jgi:hypothetical protein
MAADAPCGSVGSPFRLVPHLPSSSSLSPAHFGHVSKICRTVIVPVTQAQRSLFIRAIYCVSCLRRSFSALLSTCINMSPLPNCLAAITPRGACVSPVCRLSLLIRSFVGSFLNASISFYSPSFMTTCLSFFGSSFRGSSVLRR